MHERQKNSFSAIQCERNDSLVTSRFFLVLARSRTCPVWLDGEDAQDSNEKGRQTANDVNCFAHGDVIDLEPDWMLTASQNGKRNYHQLHNKHPASQQQRPVNLPELEPMRLERPAGYSSAHLTSSVHYTQVTVRLTYAYGSVARLPCPVRQLSNRTVRIRTISQCLSFDLNARIQ